MNADQILTEIREANLSYLMLAQSLIRSDREQALYRLGISEESASLIALLTPAQMMKIASGNTLALPLPHGRGRHGLGPAPEPRQERRQRRDLAPARLDPARRPSPGSRLIMRCKSILTEAKQISRAVALIGLGARLQVLESETDLSYERLLRLYKEVAGKSPSKGQLPFSTDWFMTWQPNIHASLFLNIHEYLNKSSELDEIDAVIKGYQLYQEETAAQGLEPLLSVTRAWRLVKFVDNGMLTMTKCSKCGGQFVTHPHEIARHYECGLCNPPARAGKGKAAGAIRMH